MTIILIIVLGICVLMGQPIAGLVLTLFIQGYMVFIGFIPIWLIIPSCLVALFLLLRGSSGY